MILVHKIKGEALFLNADLMESVYATPDTVITMVDGRKVIVTETPEEVVERVREFRASMLATSDEYRPTAGGSLIMFPRRPRDDDPTE